MELIVTKDIDELSQQAAIWITVYIEKVLKKQARFTMVLSGGSTPKKLYHFLASAGLNKKIDWERLHFFWGDERYVPFTNEHNNAGMAFESLLDLVPVNKDHIHIIRTDIEPEVSAIEYEKLLHQYFPDRDHTFDLVLLGMGDNAHTLSLFPGYEVIMEKEHWVRSYYVEVEKMYRITLTAPVVNASGRVAFLVSGNNKAQALRQVLSGAYDPTVYPAQVIQPHNDQLFWWVDKAAAIALE